MITKQQRFSYRDDVNIPAFPDEGPISVMDATCGLCAKAASWIAHNDRAGDFKIVPLQSSLGEALSLHYGLDPTNPSTWLYLEAGTAYTSLDALTRVGSRLGGIWRVLTALRILPRPLQDALYSLIARNRYRLWGRADLCSLPDPEVQKRLLSFAVTGMLCTQYKNRSKDMNISELMELYYQYEREGLHPFNAKKVSNSNTIKVVADEKYGSYIAGYRFPADSINQAVQEEIDYFSKYGKSFEWKVYGTDEPSALPAELLSQGFSQGETESFMVWELDLSKLHVETTKSTVKRVIDEAGANDAVQVSEQVWDTDFSSLKRNLIERLKNTPDQISIYVAYENDIPVSSAWITYTPKSPFAGLWGGSTLLSARGRGYYRELLYVRAKEASERGVKYLTVDASDMSRPILEKFGFRFITETRPYQYTIG